MQTLYPRQSMDLPSGEIHHAGMKMKSGGSHGRADLNEATSSNCKTSAYGSLKRPDTQNHLRSSTYSRRDWPIRCISRRVGWSRAMMMGMGLKRQVSSFNTGRTPGDYRKFIQIHTNWSPLQCALHGSGTGISTAIEISRLRRRYPSVQERTPLGCQFLTEFGAR